MLFCHSVVLFFSYVFLFCHNTQVSGLAVSISSSVSAGQTAAVNWHRNSPSDPTIFILRPRNLGNNQPSLPDTTVDSQNATNGTAFVPIPSSGRFIIESFDSNGNNQSLGATPQFNVLAAAQESSSTQSAAETAGATTTSSPASSTSVQNEATKPSSTSVGDANPLETAIPNPLHQFPSASNSNITSTTSSPSQATTPATVSPAAASTGSNGNRPGIIVGAVFAALSVLFLLVVISVLLIRRSNHTGRRTTATFFRDMMMIRTKTGRNSTASGDQPRIKKGIRYPFASFGNSHGNSDIEKGQLDVPISSEAKPDLGNSIPLSPLSIDSSNRSLNAEDAYSGIMSTIRSAGTSGAITSGPSSPSPAPRAQAMRPLTQESDGLSRYSQATFS